MTRLADFFIVGAPKCGTTALSEYLREHPMVFISTPKEPSFFCEDLPGLRYVKSRADYDRLFSRAEAQIKVTGEGSPSYLFSHVAIARIHAYNPEARLVVMLRHPVELLLSYHAQLCFSLFENELDFEAAWRLQEARAAGRSLPPGCREPAALQYASVVDFHTQLDRVYANFPREQVLILFYEDFQKDPRSVYERVLHHIGVESDGRSDFTPINRAKVAKWGWLNRALHAPPKWAVSGMAKLSGTWLHDAMVSLHGWFKAMNTQDRRPCRITAEFRAELLQFLGPQVNLLEERLGRSLAGWLK
jgi:Sulfotransferase domain